ncbi:MAG: GTPase ObgE [Bradymonadaceae bacterium]
MFVDECELEVYGGRGGDGIVSFHREKNVPRGGPDGGDGGDGGDVVFEASDDEHTLIEYRHTAQLEADPGQDGASANRTGADGDDLIAPVPTGTVVIDAETGEELADLDEEGRRATVAAGGEGGLGNTHFKSSTNRTPRRATDGEPGESRPIRLELKLIADVGLVGFPSAGKSTLVSAISAAEPEQADYPFTTMTPNLGRVQWKDYREFVVADCPGLIEGAHRGDGLGIEFLKHVERTRVLVYILDAQPQAEGVPTDRDPIDDLEILREELRSFEAELLDRPQIVALNKIDLPHVRDRADEVREFVEGELELPFLTISAATGEHLDDLRDRLGEILFTDSAPSDETPFWEE